MWVLCQILWFLAWFFLFCFHDHWKYSWRSHPVRTDSATFTVLCYPRLTLLVRKQTNNCYESFHERPPMHPQAVLLVYINDNSSKGNIPTFFSAFGSPQHKNVCLCVCVCAHLLTAVLVKLLLSGSFVQITKNTLWLSNYWQKIHKGTHHQKYNNQLLISISENTDVYSFKYITTVE